jgi:spermidine dehydrogenase
MADRDLELGMGRAISRRDFLNGVGVAAASALTAGCVGPGERGPSEPATSPADYYYPPARSGLRGSDPRSIEAAHQLAFQGRTDWGPVRSEDGDVYDLIVVGGGISGLSAAFFEMQAHPSARILILDNHDDFGGHARRNEFRVGEQMVLGYGGSQTLENPNAYSDASKGLLRDLGVQVERLDAAYDRDFYRRHGLGAGIFFDRATYGVDRVVRYEVIDYGGYLPLAPSTLDAQQAVDQMPLSPSARGEMLRLLTAHENRIKNVPAERQAEYLETISYQTFLERHFDIHEPEVFSLLEGITTDVGGTIDTAPALYVLDYVGLPGFRATSLPYVSFEELPYTAHFPDGNASIARMLVRAMIPQVAGGSTMDDIVEARFDYSRLDEADSPVRLRLNSTAIRVEHEGPPESADSVAVTYARDGQAFRARARSCVLAGYNAMIPHLCPELPQAQREALALAVKSPIIYSTVLLRNWRAWEKLRIAAVTAPGSYHAIAMLDFPVSMGGYTFSTGPDQPITVHMERFGKPAERGLPLRDQFRSERHRMLATPFADIEREIRTQLTGTLSGGGFDPGRDIEAITVNRWGHGYAYSYSPFFDDLHDEEALPHVIGRARFGRIAVANSDAGARATIDSSITQARRAIDELQGAGKC